MNTDVIGKYIKLIIVLLALVIFVLIGITFIPEVRNLVNINRTENTDNIGKKIHEDHNDKTVQKEDKELGSLITALDNQSPTSKNWLVTYENDKTSPQVGKVVIYIDSKGDEAVYKKSVNEAFTYLKGQGHEPCEEPLFSVLAIEISNPPISSWEPCS